MTGKAVEEIHPKITPFVKWAGGKRQLLDDLAKFFPKKYERYVEPFVGGGIMYLALQPQRAILGDTNEELMNCYMVVKEHLDELIEALLQYQQHVSDKDYYYSVRGQDPRSLTSVARAARFMYLNKTCYNGLYRVNRKGDFNVPFGKRERAPQLFNGDNLKAISRLLQTAELVAGDFEEIASQACAGDFVYFDPPYHRLSDKHSFTSYSINDFGEDDHKRLAQVFQQLDSNRCTVLLTNSDTPLVRNLYSGYVIEPVMTNRMINCKGSGRGNFPELIISNHGQSRLSL